MLVEAHANWTASSGPIRLTSIVEAGCCRVTAVYGGFAGGFTGCGIGVGWVLALHATINRWRAFITPLELAFRRSHRLLYYAHLFLQVPRARLESPARLLDATLKKVEGYAKSTRSRFQNTLSKWAKT